MLRGIQQNIIVIKPRHNRYFEQAFFIVKREIKPPVWGECDMIREANRLLKEGEREKNNRRKVTISFCIRSALLFLAGLLCGGGIALTFLS